MAALEQPANVLTMPPYLDGKIENNVALAGVPCSRAERFTVTHTQLEAGQGRGPVARHPDAKCWREAARTRVTFRPPRRRRRPPHHRAGARPFRSATGDTANLARRRARPPVQFAPTVGSRGTNNRFSLHVARPYASVRLPWKGGLIHGAHHSGGGASSYRESSDLITGALQRGHQLFLNHLEETRH